MPVWSGCPSLPPRSSEESASVRHFAGRGGSGPSWMSRSPLGCRRRRCGRSNRAESRPLPSRRSLPSHASSISPSTRCGPRSTSQHGALARRDPGAVRMLGGPRRSPNSRPIPSGDDPRGCRRLRANLSGGHRVLITRHIDAVGAPLGAADSSRCASYRSRASSTFGRVSSAQFWSIAMGVSRVRPSSVIRYSTATGEVSIT